MRPLLHRLCWVSFVIASLFLLRTEVSVAETLGLPCSAFTRNYYGDWKVLAPVMLHVGSKLLGPIVGTTFEPGTVINGIRVSEVLDNECWSAPLQRTTMR
jgi:hypothetical protein